MKEFHVLLYSIALRTLLTQFGETAVWNQESLKQTCDFSKKGNYTVVPVLVGSLSPEKEAMYGKIFSKYLADPQNFFVISSDFCHWGRDIITLIN